MANFWGKLIVTLREEKNLSQRQLASDAKVNRSTLRRIEEGKASGDMDTMERILLHLGHELEVVTFDSREETKRREQEMLTDPDKRSDLAAQRILSMFLLK